MSAPAPEVRSSRPFGFRLGWGVALVALSMLAFFGASAAFTLGMMSHMSDLHRRSPGAPQTPAVSSAADVTVEMRDFDFWPRDLTIQAGTRVTWVNRDRASHDATDEDDRWSTGRLGRGESETLTFDEGGTYRYICTIHPTMKGTLRVDAASP